MSAVIQPNQCNCRNCRYVEIQRSNILRAVRPAGKGISDDMVATWNDALENYPCEFNSPVKTLQITDLQFEIDEGMGGEDPAGIEQAIMELANEMGVTSEELLAILEEAGVDMCGEEKPHADTICIKVTATVIDPNPKIKLEITF